MAKMKLSLTAVVVLRRPLERRQEKARSQKEATAAVAAVVEWEEEIVAESAPKQGT